jgi:hypothetical protein
MKTLIELYDPSPIKNVLGTLTFSPDECILICSSQYAQDKERKRALRDFYKHRGVKVKLTFISVSMFDAIKIEHVIREVLDAHQDCAINISGGTDASLFATGEVAGDTPVFTYSDKKETFFEIKNAPFARSLVPDVHLDVASCMMMAGGTLLPGRANNAELSGRTEQIDSLFAIYSKFRRIWNPQVNYIQSISSSEAGELDAEGQLTEKSGGKYVTAEPKLFKALADAGLILDLKITEETIKFRFPDETVRFWLRDIGSVLELQVYRACTASGCFDDVVLSAVVNWQSGEIKRDSVSNEIDVMAVQGIKPVFISCKTSEVHTEALNELSILRLRFGGFYSRAILVTSGMASRNRANMRNRAAKLGIELIEWEDLKLDRLIKRLRNQEDI